MKGVRLFIVVVCVVGLSMTVSATTVNWSIGSDGGAAWVEGTTDGTVVDDAAGVLELATEEGKHRDEGNYTSVWKSFDSTVDVEGIRNHSVLNENHSMELWIRSAGSPDGTPSGWYGTHSAVPPNESVQVRVRLKTTNNTSTPEVNNVTVDGMIDESPPVISLTNQPDALSANDTLRYEGSLDEDGNVFYKIDDNDSVRVCSGCRSFSFMTSELEPGNYSVTVVANDTDGNEIQLDKEVRVADGSEVAFELGVDRSYPESGIPIDPDSDVWGVSTDVDFNFTLQADGDIYNISDDFGDGVCDFNGDEGWHLDGNYYCGSQIPASIDTDQSYELVAEWELREGHSRTIHESIEIGDTYVWQEQNGNHGGRVEDTVTNSMEFDGDTKVMDDGSVAVCSGSEMRVTDIDRHQIRCSNGVTQSGTPAVTSFTYDGDGNIVNTSNNDMFGGGCSIHEGITRELLRGEIGAHVDEGYLPENCNIEWQMSGDSSFVTHRFTETGDYKVYVDLVNAVSDSPDYVCPARTDNNDLCSFGSLQGDESGWETIETYNVTVVNASAAFAGMQFSSNVEQDNGYIAREDYQGDVDWTGSIENTGYGPVEITSAAVDCPASVSCDVETSLPLQVPEGDTALIDGVVSMPEGVGLTGYVNVTVSYGTGSGLSCGSTQQLTERIRIDEEKPSVADDSDDQWHLSTQQVNLTCDDAESGCEGMEYCTTQSTSCTPGTDYDGGAIGIDEEGVTTINYSGVDVVGNEQFDSTVVKKDTSDPLITCDDCFSARAVPVGTDVTVDPVIDMQGLSPLSELEYCSDSSCQQPAVMCSFQSAKACTFTYDEFRDMNVFVKAVDQAGNTVTEMIGGARFLLTENDVCQEDNQCISQDCGENRCRGDALPPEVELFE